MARDKKYYERKLEELNLSEAVKTAKKALDAFKGKTNK